MSPVTTAGMGDDDEWRRRNPFLPNDVLAQMFRDVSGYPTARIAEIMRESGVGADVRRAAAMMPLMPNVVPAIDVGAMTGIKGFFESLRAMTTVDVQELIRAASPQIDFSSITSVDMSAALRDSLATSSMRATQAVLEAQRRIEQSETRDEGEIDTDELPDDDTLTHAVEEITAAVENADVEVDDGVKAALVSLWRLVAASKLDLSVSDEKAADDLRIAITFSVMVLLSTLFIANPVIFAAVMGVGSIVEKGVQTWKGTNIILPPSAVEDEDSAEE